MIVRVGLDQKSGPVAMQFEEQRVGVQFAASCAALDEEAIATSGQKLVDERRLTNLWRVPCAWSCELAWSGQRRLRDMATNIIDELLTELVVSTIQYMEHLIRCTVTSTRPLDRSASCLIRRRWLPASENTPPVVIKLLGRHEQYYCTA